MITQQGLFELLIMHGGEIVSSNELPPEWVRQAHASGRIFVDDNGYGFVWEPRFKHNNIPTTEEEVELFEWCYPLEIPLPEGLLSPEEILLRGMAKDLIQKQKRNN